MQMNLFDFLFQLEEKPTYYCGWHTKPKSLAMQVELLQPRCSNHAHLCQLVVALVKQAL